MFYELEKVSISNFKPIPRYRTCKLRIHGNIAFFGVKCHFWPFSHKKKNQFFVEYSTGIEISTKIFYEKKLMDVVDISYKYLGLTPKSKKDIKKVNRVIFFSTSQ